MPQNTSRYRLVYWLVGDPAEIHTATQRLASSVDTALGALEDGLRALIASTANGIQNQINALSDRITDARVVRAAAITGTGTTTSAGTGRQGVPGCSFDLPAGVGAIVSATFDVTAVVYNGAGVFEGRLNIINRSTNVGDLIPKSAIWAARGAGDRVSVTQTWQIDPSSVARGVQAAIVKNNSNVDYRVENTNTVLSFILTRTGSL